MQSVCKHLIILGEALSQYETSLGELAHSAIVNEIGPAKPIKPSKYQKIMAKNQERSEIGKHDSEYCQSAARVLSLVILSQKNLVKALYSDSRKAIK